MIAINISKGTKSEIKTRSKIAIGNFAMNSRIGIITECETLLVSVLIFFIISEEFLEIISK